MYSELTKIYQAGVLRHLRKGGNIELGYVFEELANMAACYIILLFPIALPRSKFAALSPVMVTSA
jgi:hypothetical protein